MTNVRVATEGDLLTIGVDLSAVAKELSHRAEEWQQTAERTRAQYEQSEWYLGEAKASIARLEEDLQALREAYDRLEAGHREETRRVAEDCQQQLSFERAQRAALEAELAALRIHGERRRELRAFRPDMTVEVQSPAGAVLFEGRPRNISARGVGFASEEPFNDGSGSLWVTFRQPGVARPIEALGRLAWRGPEATVWGCELLDMSPGCREIFERVLADTA